MFEALAAEMSVLKSQEEILGQQIDRIKSQNQRHVSSQLQSMARTLAPVIEDIEPHPGINSPALARAVTVSENMKPTLPTITRDFQAGAEYTSGLSSLSASGLDLADKGLPKQRTRKSSPEESMNRLRKSGHIISCACCGVEVLRKNASEFVVKDDELLCPNCSTTDRHYQ